MSDSADIARRLESVRDRIAGFCLAAGRATTAVELLAVSKQQPVASIRAAYAAGQLAFGENRVQELLAKAAALADLPGLQWHLIGSLQTNKLRQLLQLPGLVLLHSLDRATLAIALQRELARTGRRLAVLLQVDATGEATKHGCPPDQALALLQLVQRDCPLLAVEGLMAMGPRDGDPAPVFRRVAALQRELRRDSGLPLPNLSMGMSGDLAAAIAAGSTMVRLGTALFGERAMQPRDVSVTLQTVTQRKKPTAAAVPAGPPAPVGEVLARLAAAIPDPRCELDHQDPWTLLIATILSAQSTDRTVNAVTPVLFGKWGTPAALAAAPREEVEAVVHRTGFFRNKAKAIQEASQQLVVHHGGQVPSSMAALLQLPGVARKTANVVLGVGFRRAEGIAVDTHVMRVAQRLGLSAQRSADKVEAELCAQLPREQWIDGGHRLLLLGRYVCLAKEPSCQHCPLQELCPSRRQPASGTVAERAARTRSLLLDGGTAGSAASG